MKKIKALNPEKPISNLSPKNPRRDFLRRFCIIGMAGYFSPFLITKTSAAVVEQQRYKVAVCDWMILKRQKLGAFALAKEIGADGIQLDMGGLGARDTFDSKLNDPENVRQFLEESKSQNIAISSIAMSGFYGQSFANRPTVPQMVDDTLATMERMDIEIAYLPLGVDSDFSKEPGLREKVIQRLKEAGEKAKKMNKVIAVETSLDAKEERAFLKEISSPAVKSSFNFANAIKNERDIIKELKILGKENIAQIHCSDTDGVWIENNPKLDMPKIKRALDKMGWSGWLIIERSRDVNDVRNVKGNYGANARYMKSVFQQESV